MEKAMKMAKKKMRKGCELIKQNKKVENER